jgi:hypothetical protein
MAVDYIAENPVAAGLCENVTDWRWSSQAVLAAGNQPLWLSRPAEVLAVQAELAALS